MEENTLKLHYGELLKACLALGENRLRFGRTWCNWSAMFKPVTNVDGLSLDMN